MEKQKVSSAQRLRNGAKHRILLRRPVQIFEFLKGCSTGVSIVTGNKFRGHKAPHFQPHRRRMSYSESSYRQLLSVILDLTTKCAAAIEVQQNPLITDAVTRNYWVVSHKLQLWNQYVLKPDPSVSAMYDTLYNFLMNSDVQATVIAVKTGIDRRNFCWLCDELSVSHRILRITGESSDYLSEEICELNVWKNPSYRRKPPSLEEILILDSQLGESRRFDGSPPYWERMSTLFTKLHPEDIGTIIGAVVKGLRVYASVTWAFKFVELLSSLSPHAPLPEGFKLGLINMCDERKDLYGLFEVLHIVSKESKYCEINDLIMEPMRPEDWESVLAIAHKCRHHERLKRESLNQYFIEVRNCEVIIISGASSKHPVLCFRL
jgi:hypothetical protein